MSTSASVPVFKPLPSSALVIVWPDTASALIVSVASLPFVPIWLAIDTTMASPRPARLMLLLIAPSTFSVPVPASVSADPVNWVASTDTVCAAPVVPKVISSLPMARLWLLSIATPDSWVRSTLAPIVPRLTLAAGAPSSTTVPPPFDETTSPPALAIFRSITSPVVSAMPAPPPNSTATPCSAVRLTRSFAAAVPVTFSIEPV